MSDSITDSQSSRFARCQLLMPPIQLPPIQRIGVVPKLLRHPQRLMLDISGFAPNSAADVQAHAQWGTETARGAYLPFGAEDRQPRHRQSVSTSPCSRSGMG